MATYLCNFCDEKFASYPSENTTFCSRRCWKKSMEQIQRRCCNAKCDKSTRVYRSDIRLNNYCSTECRNEANSGENSAHYKDAKISKRCVICDKSFSYYPSQNRNERGTPQYCSNKCMSEGFSNGKFAGKNNPFWRGGKQYYGSNWQEKREEALEEYDYSCAICGRGAEELDKSPDVHHITPLRKFDNPERANYLENLVVLCTSHHMLVERWNLIPSNVKN